MFIILDYIILLVNVSLLSFILSLFLFGYELKRIKIDGKDKIVFSWGYQYWKSKNKDRLERIKDSREKIRELKTELKQLKSVNKKLRKQEYQMNKKENRLVCKLMNTKD